MPFSAIPVWLNLVRLISHSVEKPEFLLLHLQRKLVLEESISRNFFQVIVIVNFRNFDTVPPPRSGKHIFIWRKFWTPAEHFFRNICEICSLFVYLKGLNMHPFKFSLRIPSYCKSCYAINRTFKKVISSTQNMRSWNL